MSDLTFTQGTVHVPSGRRVAFAWCGRPQGRPVFYLHGAIGSPLRCSPELREAVDALDLRLICPQRAGFGSSEPHPARTLLDTADDVEAVADRLGLGRFGVIGVSAGGPYAIACAHRFPDRLLAAAAVSSLSPMASPATAPGLPARVRVPLRAIAAAPRAATRAGDLAAGLVARHPGLLRRTMAIGAPPADKENLADGTTGGAAVDAFLDATRHGVGGLIDDHLVTTRPWGLQLADVAGEVHVWHGMHDQYVPVEHALQLAAALPRCRTSLDPEEGHFFFRRRVREILQAVTGPRPGLTTAVAAGTLRQTA